MMAKMNFTGPLGKNAPGRSSLVNACLDLQLPIQKLQSREDLGPPVSFVKSSSTNDAAQGSEGPMP